MEHLNAADYVVLGEFAIAFFGLLGWVITYAVVSRGNWRRSPEGRHLMAFRGSLVIFMAMGVANNIWLDYPGRDLVRVLVIGAFALSVTHGLRVLLRAQRGNDGVVEVVIPTQEDGAGERGPDVLRP